jgi:PDZ domain-containing protein
MTTISLDRRKDGPKVARLRSHPLLASCPSSVLRRVAVLADEVELDPGDVCARQGETPKWFVLIQSGQAEVVRDGVRLAVLGPGSYFGEVPLLGRGVHPATVRALTPVTGFGIDAQHFVPLVADVRRLREPLTASLARQASLVELSREDRRRQLGRTRPMPTWRVDTAVRIRRRWPWKWIAVAASTLAVAFVAAALYHPPIGVAAPAQAIDISRDVTITGVPIHVPRNAYLMLTIRTERPTLLGLGGALLHGNRRLVKPPSRRADDKTITNRVSSEFAQSRQNAAIAGARAAGLKVAPSGALPFNVHFRSREVVGPSAGLIYALLIHDMLSPSDRGLDKTIAATGAISASGAVSDVGFVSEKAEEAESADAEYLVVPDDQADQAYGRPMFIEGVGSLDEALRLLGTS